MQSNLKIASRSEWTDTKPKRTALSWDAVKYVAIHWPGTPGEKISTNIRALLRGWYTYHVKDRGWTDIAYNYAVDQTGKIWTLRGDYRDGATSGWGGRSVSILAVLANSETPSEAMLQSLKALAETLRGRAAKGAKIVGHKSLVSTSCPGAKISTWISEGMPVKEKAEPTMPDKDRGFRLLWANRRAERWGGLPDNSRRPGQEMKALKPSIILGCEMSELARDITRDVLGPSWITWPQGMVWVTWDKKLWREKTHSVKAFGNNIHGWVSVTLESLKDNHRSMTVVAIHNRPKSSYPGYTDAQVVEAKRATIKSALDALPTGPVIVAIDANTEKAWDMFDSHGLIRLTDDVPTHGTHKIDAIWGTPDVVRRKSEFVNNSISDHKWGILDGTLPAIVNPNT